MSNQVIKKDGTKEPFDEGKLKRSIELAGLEAGLSVARVQEIVNQVGGTALELAATQEEIATSALREKILSELDRVEPGMAEAWRKYDQKRGY